MVEIGTLSPVHKVTRGILSVVRTQNEIFALEDLKRNQTIFKNRIMN